MKLCLSAWITKIIVLTFLSQTAGQVLAQSLNENDDFVEPYENDPAPANPSVVEMDDVDVIDLNEINLREAQQSWESTQRPTGSDVTDSIRIDEIIEPSGEYRYSSFGKPDPFQQPTVQQTSSISRVENRNGEVSGSEIPMVSPLQAYPLDELEVKGVWVLKGGETRAIIMTPKKEGIVVKVGDPIAAGKILSIKRTQLKVRQYRIREDGVREFEDLEMNFGIGQDQPKGIIRLNPGKEPEFVQFVEPGRPAPAAPNPIEAAEAPPIPGEAVRTVGGND